jgi:hypothetical protein
LAAAALAAQLLQEEVAQLLEQAPVVAPSQQVVQAQAPVLAVLVVLARLPLEAAPLRLSRQSFSAAMARSTPRPRTTYEPVPRSR